MDDDARRGRMLTGEVHDNYAAALGGVAGHAGLFGTAPAVGAFARARACAPRAATTTLPAPFTPALVRAVHDEERCAGSSRALGWDTMLPTSSCGTPHVARRPSVTSGFTGTSLWIDPGARSLLRAADQPRLRRRHARRDAHGAPGVSRCARGCLTAERAEHRREIMFSAFSAISAVSLL